MRSIFFVLLLCLVGCEKSGTNEHTLFQATPVLDKGVSFNTLKNHILTPMCVRCHAWADDEAEVKSRIIPKNAEDSLLYKLVKNGSMPEGGPVLTTAQLEVVEAYINSVRVVEPVRPKPPVVEPPVVEPPIVEPPVVRVKATYEDLKVHLFEKSCTMCHAPNRRRPDLTDYDSIVANIVKIEEELEMETMPPTDSSGNPRAPIPEPDVMDAFRIWITIGLPRQ